jgi:hypothetical protein
MLDDVCQADDMHAHGIPLALQDRGLRSHAQGSIIVLARLSNDDSAFV